MKNVMLRATRTFIEDLCAPEYAHNHLAVEISHPDGFTDTQELSIRVYSSEYRLLALHFCGKQTALCSHFSLQELLEGSLQWKVLQEKMDTRKVVLVEVPYKEYSRQESNLLDLLGNLMEQKTSSGPIFIFYGTMDSTYQLRRCSTAMSRIFTEENTIGCRTGLAGDGGTDPPEGRLAGSPDAGRLHETAYGIRARHGAGQPPPHAVLRQSRYRKDDGGQTHRTAVSPDGTTFQRTYHRDMPHKAGRRIHR